jgi:hypothetical protein
VQLNVRSMCVFVQSAIWQTYMKCTHDMNITKLVVLYCLFVRSLFVLSGRSYDRLTWRSSIGTDITKLVLSYCFVGRHSMPSLGPEARIPQRSTHRRADHAAEETHSEDQKRGLTEKWSTQRSKTQECHDLNITNYPVHFYCLRF